MSYSFSGSVIVGSKQFITKAIRVRKALGGGMRQVGILAAAGLYGLNHNKDRMIIDHQNAKTVARGFYRDRAQGGPPWCW